MMTPENYVNAEATEPLDAEEIREALLSSLLSAAPPALVRVIGRSAFEGCAEAWHHFLNCLLCLSRYIWIQMYLI